MTVAPSSTDVSAPELHAAAAATAPHVQETPEQKEHAQHHFASAEDLQANAVAATRKARYTVFGKNRSRVKTASAVDILRATLEKEGVLGWYKGMQAQILKAVLSQGKQLGNRSGSGWTHEANRASSLLCQASCSWPRASSRHMRCCSSSSSSGWSSARLRYEALRWKKDRVAEF